MDTIYLDLPEDVKKAIKLNDFAMAAWWSAVKLSRCEAGLQRQFVEECDTETRQKLMRVFCMNGPSEHLRQLLNADALFRCEHHSVRKRMDDREDFLATCEKLSEAEREDLEIILHYKINRGW